MNRHRPYRPPRPRPVPARCQACAAARPPNRLYYYVDGNNGAITAGSPALCYDCYCKRHGPQPRPPQEEA